MGEENFIEEVFLRAKQERKKAPMMEDVVKKICDYYGVKDAELSAGGKSRKASAVRGVIAWLVLETGKLTLTELSKRLKRDVSTLSSAAQRVFTLSNEDTELAKELQKLKHELFRISKLQA